MIKIITLFIFSLYFSNVSIAAGCIKPLILSPGFSLVFVDVDRVEKPFVNLKSNLFTIQESQTWIPRDVMKKNFPDLDSCKEISKYIIMADKVSLENLSKIDLGGARLEIIAKEVSIGSRVKFLNAKGVNIFTEDLLLKGNKFKFESLDAQFYVEETVNISKLAVNVYKLNGWENILRFSTQLKTLNDGKIIFDEKAVPHYSFIKKLYDLFIYSYKEFKLDLAYEKAQALINLFDPYILDIVDNNELDTISLLVDPESIEQVGMIRNILSYFEQLKTANNFKNQPTHLIHKDKLNEFLSCDLSADLMDFISSTESHYVDSSVVFKKYLSGCPLIADYRKKRAKRLSSLSLQKLINNLSKDITSLEKNIDENRGKETAYDEASMISINKKLITLQSDKMLSANENKITQLMENFKILNRNKENIYKSNTNLRTRITSLELKNSLIDMIPTADAEPNHVALGVANGLKFLGGIATGIGTAGLNPGPAISAMGSILESNAREKQAARQRQINKKRREINNRISKISNDQLSKDIKTLIMQNSNELLNIESQVYLNAQDFINAVEDNDRIKQENTLELAKVGVSRSSLKSDGEYWLSVLSELYIGSVHEILTQIESLISRKTGLSLGDLAKNNACHFLTKNSIDQDDYSSQFGFLDTVFSDDYDATNISIINQFNACLSEVKKIEENYFINDEFSKDDFPILNYNGSDTYNIQYIGEVINIFDKKCLSNDDDLYGEVTNTGCGKDSSEFTKNILKQGYVDFAFDYTDDLEGVVKSSDETYFSKPRKFKLPQLIESDVFYELKSKDQVGSVEICSVDIDSNRSYVSLANRSDNNSQLTKYVVDDVSFKVELGLQEEVQLLESKNSLFFNLSSNNSDVGYSFVSNGISFESSVQNTLDQVKTSSDVKRIFDKGVTGTNRGERARGRSPINTWRVSLQVEICENIPKENNSLYAECIQEVLSCFDNIKYLLYINYLD